MDGHSERTGQMKIESKIAVGKTELQEKPQRRRRCKYRIILNLYRVRGCENADCNHLYVPY